MQSQDRCHVPTEDTLCHPSTCEEAAQTGEVASAPEALADSLVEDAAPSTPRRLGARHPDDVQSPVKSSRPIELCGTRMKLAAQRRGVELLEARVSCVQYIRAFRHFRASYRVKGPRSSAQGHLSCRCWQAAGVDHSKEFQKMHYKKGQAPPKGGRTLLLGLQAGSL